MPACLPDYVKCTCDPHAVLHPFFAAGAPFPRIHYFEPDWQAGRWRHDYGVRGLSWNCTSLRGRNYPVTLIVSLRGSTSGSNLLGLCLCYDVLPASMLPFVSCAQCRRLLFCFVRFLTENCPVPCVARSLNMFSDDKHLHVTPEIFSDDTKVPTLRKTFRTAAVF
jgi:hypothetical protein